MTAVDFATSIRVAATAREVYNAINSPRDWWALGIEGVTDIEGEVFYHHFQDVHYCKLQVDELIPDKRVTWKVLANYFSFIGDQREWTGTRIIFDISSQGDQTALRFTHEGLVPDYECYELCENEWTKYISKSLYGLITKSAGAPNAIDDKQFDKAFENWKSANQ
jgi:hypothetical protein